MSDHYQLFAWNYSYFSAKVRAYMKYKRHVEGLPFEEIMATREIITGLMIPATGSNVVPQVRQPDGSWLQDSSEIIDVLEQAYPGTPVIPKSPRQQLASYLLELLADEWMLPWGFWERWYYSLATSTPNHEAFNALQWGRMFNATGSGNERIEAARFVFRERMKIDAPETADSGPYAGLVQLGVTDATIDAWTQSMHHMLSLLEAHLDHHDYLLGGIPTLADFAFIGPLYPHLYKDPVPGMMMRSDYPLVSEWIERVNGNDEAGYGSYREVRYDLVDGELSPRPPGNLLPDDEIPDTLLPLLSVFFEEMWPVLDRTITVVSDYMASEACRPGTPLPGKSFYSPAAFSALQSGDGPLTVAFELNGVTGYRMASPYHVWMLQRLHAAVGENLQSPAITSLLDHVANHDFQLLGDKLASCPVKKHFEALTAG